ncbi:MAG: DUF2125 domain-containing protein [Bauldia sp.]
MGRRGTGWLVGVIVLLGLLWVGYWYAAHYAAETAIARAGARGIACGSVDLSGFPLQLDLRCDKATYAGANSAATGAIAGFTAHAPLYQPGQINAKLEAPLTLNVPGRNLAVTANWTAGSATGGAGFSGLNAASAAFTTLKVESSGGLPIASATADSASGAISPADGSSYNLASSIRHLLVTPTDAAAYPQLDLDLAATAHNVGALGVDPQRAIVAWLRGTPELDISSLRLAAQDAVIAASGTLSLSKDGLLNGSILLRYNNIDALANLVETLHPGAKEKYAVAFQGIAGMSKKVDTTDGPMLQTALTFTDGLIWLTVIPLPVTPIPPIRF